MKLSHVAILFALFLGLGQRLLPLPTPKRSISSTQTVVLKAGTAPATYLAGRLHLT